MNDIKVIELMEKFFGEKAMKLEMETSPERKPDERRALATKMRKMVEKYLAWYEDNYKSFYPQAWEQAGDDKNKIRFDLKSIDYLKTVIPDSLGIKDVAENDKEMVPVLRDFAQRNVKPEDVREHFEGYLDKIKEGWTKKLEEAKKRSG